MHLSLIYVSSFVITRTSIPYQLSEVKSVALVTGASGVIGSEIVAGLVEAGLDVIVACRTGHQVKCAEEMERHGISQNNLVMESVDFASINSTLSFVHRIASKYAYLRVIVNCVAVFPQAGLSIDGLNINFQVNVYCRTFLQ